MKKIYYYNNLSSDNVRINNINEKLKMKQCVQIKQIPKGLEFYENENRILRKSISDPYLLDNKKTPNMNY